MTLTTQIALVSARREIKRGENVLLCSSDKNINLQSFIAAEKSLRIAKFMTVNLYNRQYPQQIEGLPPPPQPGDGAWGPLATTPTFINQYQLIDRPYKFSY